jgi:hypothetical protein
VVGSGVFKLRVPHLCVATRSTPVAENGAGSSSRLIHSVSMCAALLSSLVSFSYDSKTDLSALDPTAFVRWSDHVEDGQARRLTALSSLQGALRRVAFYSWC